MTELSIILFALVVLMAVLIIVRVNYIERKIKEKKPVNGTTFFIIAICLLALFITGISGAMTLSATIQFLQQS